MPCLVTRCSRGLYLMSHQHSHFKVRRAECPVPGDHIGPTACNWRAPGDLSSYPTPSDTWAPAAALECGFLRKHSTTTGETEAGQQAVENPLLDLPAQPVPCWAGLGEELSLSGPQTRLQQRPHCALNTCRGAVGGILQYTAWGHHQACQHAACSLSWCV